MLVSCLRSEAHPHLDFPPQICPSWGLWVGSEEPGADPEALGPLLLGGELHASRVMRQALPSASAS